LKQSRVSNNIFLLFVALIAIATLCRVKSELEVLYVFADCLTRLRQEKGLTQTELAELVSISRSALSLYELGKREPDFKTLEKLADFFGVSIDYLLGRTSIQAPNKSYPAWLDKVPIDLREQILDLASTGDMGALYLRAGIGMAKNAQLNDYPPDALEAIAKAAINGGMMVRKKRLELEREGKAKEKEDQ
jgi:transcriptional regulator with XRE-family HTH domain